MDKHKPPPAMRDNTIYRKEHNQMGKSLFLWVFFFIKNVYAHFALEGM